MKAAFMRVESESVAVSKCNQAFADLDTDQDGVVSLAEWLSFFNKMAELEGIDSQSAVDEFLAIFKKVFGI